MIWNWLRRQPLLVDVGLVALLLAVTIVTTRHRGHPSAACLLGVFETLALLLAAERPVDRRLVVTARPSRWSGSASGCCRCSSRLRSTRSPRARATPAAASRASPRRVGADVRRADYTAFGDSAARVVFLIAAWLLGDSIGSRRAYLREIEEKAERLERERETEARRIVAEEQARIARELHDVVAHALSVIVVQAGAADDVFDIEPTTRARADPSDRRRGAGGARRPAPRARHPAGRRAEICAATGAGAAGQARRPGSRDRTRCGARDRGRRAAAAGRASTSPRTGSSRRR